MLWRMTSYVFGSLIIFKHWQTTTFNLVFNIFIKTPQSANSGELNCLSNRVIYYEFTRNC